MSESDLRSGVALRDAKRALRAQVIAARDARDPAWREEASLRICARIEGDPSWHAARLPLLTFAWRSEWNPMSLVVAAIEAGKAVAAPRVDAGSRMLTLHRIADPAADLAPGFHDIPEPRPHCPECAPDSIDWVLVPGVAFDARGARLGYGGGFYDRLLPQLRDGVPRVAGAFDFQIVDRVPTTPQDLRVDRIATETRMIEAVA